MVVITVVTPGANSNSSCSRLAKSAIPSTSVRPGGKETAAYSRCRLDGRHPRRGKKELVRGAAFRRRVRTGGVADRAPTDARRPRRRSGSGPSPRPRSSPSRRGTRAARGRRSTRRDCRRSRAARGTTRDTGRSPASTRSTAATASRGDGGGPPRSWPTRRRRTGTRSDGRPCRSCRAPRRTLARLGAAGARSGSLSMAAARSLSLAMLVSRNVASSVRRSHSVARTIESASASRTDWASSRTIASRSAPSRTGRASPPRPGPGGRPGRPASGGCRRRAAAGRAPSRPGPATGSGAGR